MIGVGLSFARETRVASGSRAAPEAPVPSIASTDDIGRTEEV